MTTALVTALFLLAFLWQAHTFNSERKQWTLERSQLLNRIKPETAQHVPFDEPVETFQPAPLEDDEAYWELRKAEA